jgi:hypothetical protein
MEYKYIKVAEGVVIPVRVDLTAEQEAEIVAQYIAENNPDEYMRRLLAEEDPAEIDALLQDALEHPEKCVSFEELIAEIERDFPAGTEDAA